jgi:hypothetical protein
MDFFCLSSSGIRIGYPSPKLLKTLKRSKRARYSGRAVLILTANRHFTLRGIRLGSRVSRRMGKPFKVGLNTWYLIGNGSSRGILKTRHGQIQEIGVANKALTAGRARARRFLESFS